MTSTAKVILSLILSMLLITLYNFTDKSKNVLIYDNLVLGLGDKEANLRLIIAAKNLNWQTISHSKAIKENNFDHSKNYYSILIQREENTTKILKFNKYPEFVKKFLIIWGCPPNFLNNYKFNDLIDYFHKKCKFLVNGYLVTYGKQLFLSNLTLIITI